MAKDTNDWTLEAVAFYGETGADIAAVIEYIDYRDHYRYSQTEIKTAWKRLVKQEKVIPAYGKILSQEVATPIRTRLSFARGKY